MKKPVCFVALLAACLPVWADDVIIESRPVASWQRAPGGPTSVSGERWLQLQTQMEQMQQELQMLRGLAEENRYQLEQMEQRQQALASMQVQRAAAAAPAAPSLPVEQPESEPVQPAQLAMPEPEFPADDRQAYQLAYQQLQEKNYPVAEKFLKQYLVSFGEEGLYRPNVHYWLGELYLINGQLEQADDAFETVVLRYPEHQKASDALLKRGYVQYSKQNWTMAKAYFNDVKARFPGTAAARLAEARLIQMKKNNQT